jgi:5-methylcytosine-specific restriction endonuclease McrA
MDIVSRKQVYSICGNFESLSLCELFLVTYCLAKFACVRQELVVDHAVPPSFGTPRG